MLLQILSTKPELILGDGNPEVIKTILLAFIFMDRKQDFVTEETLDQMTEVLKKWKNDPAMVAIISKITFTDTKRQQLENIMKSLE
jgi:hypothetical protein